MSTALRFRLVAVVSAIAVVGALTACGGGDPTTPSTSTPNNTDTAVGALGEAPGPSGTTTPPPAPPPVPESSVPSKVGYVWAPNPTDAAYNATDEYKFNSTGGAISIARSSVGRYAVTFAGLADSGGVAHAQAYGSNAYCNVDSWSPSGTAQVVNLSCRNPTGALADSRFTASFASGRMGRARFAYLWANEASATARYAPSASYAYDAVNTAGLGVQRTAVGRYDVSIPSSGPNLPDAWTVQVSGYATDARCKVASFSEATQLVKVDCRTPAGALVDARFSLTFASEGSAVGRTDRKFGFYADNESTTANPAAGQYTVTAEGNGGAGGLVAVTARGNENTYCSILSWNPSGANMVISVGCYNPGGTATNSGFEVALSL